MQLSLMLTTMASLNANPCTELKLEYICLASVAVMFCMLHFNLPFTTMTKY
jgi:hypothetical protein